MYHSHLNKNIIKKLNNKICNITVLLLSLYLIYLVLYLESCFKLVLIFIDIFIHKIIY